MTQVAQNVEIPRIGRTGGFDLAFTGPATPAGRYLRRFWHPVYHSVDLASGRAVPLRIMNDNFTLYRGEGGETHLTEARCPHRGTQLSTGWVEGEALRCFYHGWKFGPDGQCLEQPAEESSFCHKISVKTWPTREYLGLIFAFLGDGTPPEFSRYPEFERFDGLVEIDSYSRNCNYFQNLENALDMAHVGFVHGDNRASFAGIGLGRSLQAVESSWGVTYTFTRADGRRRVQQFGMPNIFYMSALPNEADVDWQESLFWWVPVDDDTHMQFSLHRVPMTGEAVRLFKARRETRGRVLDIAHQDLCEDILDGKTSLADIDKSRVDIVRLQDDIAQVGQGRFADRTRERVGRADVGVTLTRRVWRREIEASMDERPLKSWERTSDIVPRVWDLTPGADGDATLASTETDVTPQIIDIRPWVEVSAQLAVLHGARSRR
jgi:5,5'-dehydrodivanillate O-demethylase